MFFALWFLNIAYGQYAKSLRRYHFPFISFECYHFIMLSCQFSFPFMLVSYVVDICLTWYLFLLNFSWQKLFCCWDCKNRNKIFAAGVCSAVHCTYYSLIVKCRYSRRQVFPAQHIHEWYLCLLIFKHRHRPLSISHHWAILICAVPTSPLYPYYTFDLNPLFSQRTIKEND